MASGEPARSLPLARSIAVRTSLTVASVEVVAVKVPVRVPEKFRSPNRPLAVSVRCSFMLNGVLNVSAGSVAELVVVTVAPGMNAGVEEPSSADELPSAAAARVTLPVPLGKTEVGKALARILGAELIRLQCYEGIDSAQALYEWDYSRQLLYARALQAGDLDPRGRVSELYGPDFLLERPLLRAIRDYLDHYNRSPKPFVWTKDADTILGKIARVSNR